MPLSMQKIKSYADGDKGVRVKTGRAVRVRVRFHKNSCEGPNQERVQVIIGETDRVDLLIEDPEIPVYIGGRRYVLRPAGE